MDLQLQASVFSKVAERVADLELQRKDLLKERDDLRDELTRQQSVNVSVAAMVMAYESLHGALPVELSNRLTAFWNGQKKRIAPKVDGIMSDVQNIVADYKRMKDRRDSDKR